MAEHEIIALNKGRLVLQAPTPLDTGVVEGNLRVAGDLDIEGAVNLQEINVTGNVDIGGDAEVGGSLNVVGPISTDDAATTRDNLGLGDISTTQTPAAGRAYLELGPLSTVPNPDAQSIIDLRDDLAEEDGSDLVGFNQGTAQAVDETVQDVLRETASVKRYGALGNGVADDYAAIVAAITDNPGKCIHFPAGTYLVSDTVEITSAGTVLEGDGPGITFVSQTTPDIDTFLFKPITAGVTSAYLSGSVIRGINVSHGSVAASSTMGAGIRFLQCANYKLYNATVNDAPEGITIQGGQFGSLKSFQVFVATGMSPDTDTALLYFRQAPYGSGQFQSCFTVQVEDFRFSASLLRETCILIQNADGLSFNNGYISRGDSSLVKVKAERDNSYLAAVNFSGVYFDCVNATDYAVDIAADGFANTFVYTFIIGSGCSLGNGLQSGVICRKPETVFLSIDNAQILNFVKWAVDVEGSTAQTDLSINATQIQNVGDGTSGGIRAAVGGRSLRITGNNLRTTETVCVNLSGTWGQGTITGNTNSSAVSELINTATFNNPLVLAGNSGVDTNASTSWRGIRPGNLAISNTVTLDWYEEGTFTPTLSFGGASVGITYGSQIGQFTRIGNTVFFSLNMTLTSKGSSTGNALISGLPYSSSGAFSACPLFFTAQLAGVGEKAQVAQVISGSATVAPYEVSGLFGNQTQMTDASFGNTAGVRISGNYRV